MGAKQSICGLTFGVGDAEDLRAAHGKNGTGNS